MAATPAAAGSVDWTQGPSQGPSPRIGAYMAYDSVRGRTVLFGGAPASNTLPYDGDTWQFDGITWTQAAVGGPQPRALGQMVYDSARGVSVLFGGSTASTALGDTWEWDGSGWVQRNTAHSPAPRFWFGMTYDSARHVTVLFGGSGSGGNLGDTWEYDGSDWRYVATAHSPSARMGLGLAFDPSRGRTVLFGGHNAGRLNDTWEYDGTDWTQVNPATAPAPRFWHSMSYNPMAGGVVVFGGDYLTSSTLGPNNETWVYDGTTWRQLHVTASPSPRIYAAMAEDSGHSALVLFGGDTEIFPDTALGDTWSLSLPTSPVATLSTNSITYPATPVLSSTGQTVTLTNTGLAPLTLVSLSASGTNGDFTTTDNCPHSPATLAPNAACAITVNFVPTTGGYESGSVTVSDNAGTGSQSVSLAGVGEWGAIAAAPAPIDFGSSIINRAGTTAGATETISFPAQPSLVTAIETTPPFIAYNLDCPLTTLLSNGATCHVSVGFAPNTPGSYSGQLIIHDDEPGLERTVALSGTALPPPLNFTLLQVTGDSIFAHSIDVLAETDAGSGIATFTFNGHPVGAPVSLYAGHASQTINLDDSVVPSGAGTYPLVVTVHSTDPNVSDNSITRSITVIAVPYTLSWQGSALITEGTGVKLSVKLMPPFGDQSHYDFKNHPVWVRFDLTGGSGTTTSYYAQATGVVTPSGYFGQAVASATVPSLTAGGYRVRIRVVSDDPSASANAYAAAEDLYEAFAVEPVRGGFMAGAGQDGGMALAFDFSPGSSPTGSLDWVQATQVVGADGQWQDAYIVYYSTSVSSVESHSHTATASGKASVAIYDATTGARYPAFDQTTTFTLTVHDDGSVSLISDAGTWAGTLTPGAAVHHL